MIFESNGAQTLAKPVLVRNPSRHHLDSRLHFSLVLPCNDVPYFYYAEVPNLPRYGPNVTSTS